MKVEKSTKILIHLVMVLVMALLLKFLITTPRDLEAKRKLEYQVYYYDVTDFHAGKDHLQRFLNKQAAEGWKLQGWLDRPDIELGIYAIFER